MFKHIVVGVDGRKGGRDGSARQAGRPRPSLRNSPLSELQSSIALAPRRRPAILAVDDDPAALAAVALDERGFLLAGPDVRARSIKRDEDGWPRVPSGWPPPEKTTAAAVHLTSDDADYFHATALHIDGGRVGSSDRRALSGSRTGLLWRNHTGRIVGSVIAASGNSLLVTKEKDRGED